MSSADDATAAAGSDAPVRRRDLAVARSLDSARVRSEGRVQRFLDAGFELLASAESGRDFTVQEVVDRSGQSLRSFYQYFAGKHELLLALFDEAIRSTAERLEDQLAKERTPLERLDGSRLVEMEDEIELVGQPRMEVVTGAFGLGQI